MQQAATTHWNSFPGTINSSSNIGSTQWNSTPATEQRKIECYRCILSVHRLECEFLIPVGKGDTDEKRLNRFGRCSCDEWVKLFEEFKIPILLNRETNHHHQFCILEFLQQIIFYSFSVVLFCLFTGKELFRRVTVFFLKDKEQPVVSSATSNSFISFWRIVIFLYDYYYYNNYKS